jgi:glycosyltransferase involved in cell wall biosynthesis
MIKFNIFFVLYHDFRSQSAIHVFNLANELVKLECNCIVCVPDCKETIVNIGDPLFDILTFDEALEKEFLFSNNGRETLVHAWTPRELVRSFTLKLSSKLNCPYFVHLEDNEEHILSRNLGMPFDQIKLLCEHKQITSIGTSLIHPQKCQEFLSSAAGITTLLDRLLEFKPSNCPGLVFWPGFDEELFSQVPVNYDLRRSLGIKDSDVVLVYPGNVHVSNRKEVASLYLAVGLLNRRGFAVKLIRTGVDHVGLLNNELKGALNPLTINLKYLRRKELAKTMAAADVFVQPGCSDDFNDFRFPSKLPEFFAMGRPTIMPNANLGRFVENGKECLLLGEGNALEISRKIIELLESADLMCKLGANARAFAEKYLTWKRAARKVAAFYDQVMHKSDKPFSFSMANESGSKSKACVNSFSDTLKRYSNYRSPILGYSIVRDYCDSIDHLNNLSQINHDLKDVQRPWIFKAIVGTTKPGKRLLEIGAGTPYIADMLADSGYDVTIIDPYEGSSNGPTEFESLTRMYPRIRFIRAHFPDGLDSAEEKEFDCIYSVSVLEHISTLGIRNFIQGILMWTTKGGFTIHAIDHVLRGLGADDHYNQLLRITSGFGINKTSLDAIIGQLETDPETYFLSAESHNLWRGTRPYDEFPMRSVVSINVCVNV